MPANDERPVVMDEAMSMEMMAMDVMAMPEPVPAKVSVAKVPAAAMEAAEAAAAAMTNLDGQIVGENFRLRGRARADQRGGLCRDAWRSEGHKPRHGEETKQSLHL
jgi:hypothetical protein